MKFSESWLREWVNIGVSSEELQEQLTLLGLEVDDVIPAGGDFEGVVVGEIKEAEQHPDADRLRVCKVDDGTGEIHNVVCGAPNARAGIKVPFARIGAVLPGGFKIKRAKLRGVESFGMLCSAKELELSEESDGLHELPVDAPSGTTLNDYLQLDDQIIEIDLTPNRGDCLSIRGIAREISTRNSTAMIEPMVSAAPTSHKDTFPVEIATDSCCARFCGRVIRGIDATASTPLWMVEKLRRCGVRSISPSVDVTNYVMLEMGQPMHAFDLDKLDGGIKVRLATEKEKLKLLDGREVELDADTTVIADHSRAVAIAGIMGGDDTGVTSDTTNIMLEAALFMPRGIAGKPRHYDAYTDSAQRFERGIDSELQPFGIERATRLLTDIVGGEVGPIFETRNESHKRDFGQVTLGRERLDRFLGVVVPDDKIDDIFGRLGIDTKKTDSGWSATSPSWRWDIAIEEDLIEEVARVHGFNQIPRTNPAWTPTIAVSSESALPANSLQQLLIDRGYQEAVCYSFVDDRQKGFAPDLDALALANPIATTLSEMRHTLWLGLCDVMQSNINRQQGDVKLFECGLKFVPQGNDLIQKKVLAGLVSGNTSEKHWSGPAAAADFYDVKADVEALLAAASGKQFSIEPDEHPALHPGISAAIKSGEETAGWLGSLHPKLQKTLDLSQVPIMFEIDMAVLEEVHVPVYTEISKFPSVHRDLSVTLDENIPFSTIKECVEKHAPESVREVRLLDIYTGKGITVGLRSVALGLILQDFSSTLGDNEIETAMSQVLDGLSGDLGATLRT